MLNKIVFIVLFLGAIGARAAAGNSAASVEMAGRGGLYSLNFDTVLTGSFYVGAGFSNWRTDGSNGSVSVFIIPVYISYYFTEGIHRIYATEAVDFISSSGSFDKYGINSSAIVLPMGVGYEYRPDNSFLVRAIPYLFVRPGSTYLGAGLSLGYTF